MGAGGASAGGGLVGLVGALPPGVDALLNLFLLAAVLGTAYLVRAWPLWRAVAAMAVVLVAGGAACVLVIRGMWQ